MMDCFMRKVTPHKENGSQLRTKFYESSFKDFKLKKKAPILKHINHAVPSTSISVSPISKRTPFISLQVNQDTNKTKSRQQSPNSINVALQKSMQNPNLTGDFSQICRLPVVHGSHEDLRCIAPVTMAILLKEKHLNYSIFDCRFPYEYAGGHIEDAENIYIQDNAIKRLFSENVCNKHKDGVLIFYCEFSSKRAPNMIRFIRNYDRSINLYPALNYPEMYLIEGGYKAFYQGFKEYCNPPAYKEMLAEDCAKELLLFKGKCDSKKSLRRIITKKLPFKLI